MDYLSDLCLGSFCKVVYTIIWVDHFSFFFFTFVLFLSDNFGSNKGMIEGRNEFSNDYALKWQNHLRDVKLLAREPLASS